MIADWDADWEAATVAGQTVFTRRARCAGIALLILVTKPIGKTKDHILGVAHRGAKAPLAIRSTTLVSAADSAILADSICVADFALVTFTAGAPASVIAAVLARAGRGAAVAAEDRPAAVVGLISAKSGAAPFRIGRAAALTRRSTTTTGFQALAVRSCVADATVTPCRRAGISRATGRRSVADTIVTPGRRARIGRAAGRLGIAAIRIASCRRAGIGRHTDIAAAGAALDRAEHGVAMSEVRRHGALPDRYHLHIGRIARRVMADRDLFLGRQSGARRCGEQGRSTSNHSAQDRPAGLAPGQTPRKIVEIPSIHGLPFPKRTAGPLPNG